MRKIFMLVEPWDGVEVGSRMIGVNVDKGDSEGSGLMVLVGKGWKFGGIEVGIGF